MGSKNKTPSASVYDLSNKHTDVSWCWLIFPNMTFDSYGTQKVNYMTSSQITFRQTIKRERLEDLSPNLPYKHQRSTSLLYQSICFIILISDQFLSMYHSFKGFDLRNQILTLDQRERITPTQKQEATRLPVDKLTCHFGLHHSFTLPIDSQ